MTAHGMESPAVFGQVGSARPAVPPPGVRRKLTLSWPNPGHSVCFLYCPVLHSITLPLEFCIFWEVSFYFWSWIQYKSVMCFLENKFIISVTCSGLVRFFFASSHIHIMRQMCLNNTVCYNAKLPFCYNLSAKHIRFPIFLYSCLCLKYCYKRLSYFNFIFVHKVSK